jgi:phage head maturation protease
MALEREFVSLVNFKQFSEGTGELEGYASVFNEIDEGGDLIQASAFTETAMK